MRSAASINRGRPHPAVEDPDAPGCCATCHRPLAAANDKHVLPDVDPAAAELDARRLGEHPEREDDTDG